MADNCSFEVSASTTASAQSQCATVLTRLFGEEHEALQKIMVPGGEFRVVCRSRPRIEFRRCYLHMMTDARCSKVKQLCETHEVFEVDVCLKPWYAFFNSYQLALSDASSIMTDLSRRLSSRGHACGMVHIP